MTILHRFSENFLITRWRLRSRMYFLLVLTFSMASSPANARQGLPDFISLVSGQSPTVVNISSDSSSRKRKRQSDIDDLPKDSPFRDYLEQFQKRQKLSDAEPVSLGSGFVIDSDGYILTCAHVVEGERKIVVRLNDRREFKADIIGLDKSTDVALLKIKATGLQRVRVGNPDRLSVGEWVLAIGSPFGFDSSATAGIVSAKGRTLPSEIHVPFIQTDVAINPGNSGGPLFNLDGEVIGINAQIYSRTGGFMGLSFAVPINLAMRVADQLRKHGKIKRAWLGLNVERPDSNSKVSGAKVAEVLASSPAEAAGIRAGDIVVSVGDKSINALEDLPRAISEFESGDQIQLTFWRERSYQTRDVIFAEEPKKTKSVNQNDALAAQTEQADPESGERVWGMLLQEGTTAQGLVVHRRVRGPARRAGLRAGDVLLEIAGSPISNLSELAKVRSQIAQTTGNKRSVAVKIKRKSKTLLLALRPE